MTLGISNWEKVGFCDLFVSIFRFSFSLMIKVFVDKNVATLYDVTYIILKKMPTCLQGLIRIQLLSYVVHFYIQDITVFVVLKILFSLQVIDFFLKRLNCRIHYLR